MRKKILVGLAVLFAVLAAWRIISHVAGGKDNSGRPRRPPVAVEVDTVRVGEIREVRQFTGTVFPKYQYVVAPKVSGRLIAIHKRIGDAVIRGELIARIDDAEYQQGVLEAEAALKIAEASLAEFRVQFRLASQEKTRVESLQVKGIASPSELDAAVANYTAQDSRLQLAEAQIEQRKASLQVARIRLGYTRLTASKPGLVGERFVDEGALLAPNAAVVSVIGIDSVIVRTTVIERDYAFIKTAQPAVVRVDAFPSERFSGSVARIAPMLQEATRVAQMEVEIVNDPSLLKPGMFARVEVVTAKKQNAQYVPTRAVVTRDGDTMVFVVEGDEPITRQMTIVTGITTLKDTEIVSPVIEGIVVTLGQHLLNDGSPVLLPQPSSGGMSAEKTALSGKKRQ